MDQQIWRNPVFLEKIPTLFLADFDLAYTLLSTIATSILTMTSISFSSILVVMTTYVSQFSPRSLQNFITDHHTQRILGVFISGFVYSIVLLLLTKHSSANGMDVLISPVFAVLIAIVSVGFFVFFVHHVAKWIQVRNLIQNIYNDTLNVMNRYWDDIEDEKEDDPWEDWEGEETLEKHFQQIAAAQPGYVQWIHFQELVEQSKKDDTLVELLYSHGDYLGKGMPIMRVYGNEGKIKKAKYNKYMIIGNARESIQDVRYGIIKMVEISTRSLSPGINDPFTAIECINYLGHTLAALSRKTFMENYLHDRDGNLRVLKKVYTFHDYLYQSFFQIRFYGRDDVAVLNALLDALHEISTHGKGAIQEDIWRFCRYIAEGIKQETFLDMDLDQMQEKLDHLAVMTSAPKNNRIRLRQSNDRFNDHP